MNTKNLWIACLTGAGLTTLISNIPFVGLVNCALCAGFWGCAIFATWFYRRLSGTLTVRQGVVIGALTGLLAGIFGFLLSTIGLAGASGFLNSYGHYLTGDAGQGITDSLSGLSELGFNLIGVLCNLVFGTVGGFIGGSIFKRTIASDQN